MRTGTEQAVLLTALMVAGAVAHAEARPASAQPLTERTVNLEGAWVPASHDLFFDLAHRFEIAGEDRDLGDIFGDGKVVNYPTFGLAYGIADRAALGVRYSTNSLIAGRANEWQPYAKIVPVKDAGGVSVALVAGWNGANESVDGEASVQSDLGRLRLIGAVRGFSAPLAVEDRPDEAEWALAGGARLALNENLALAADYANMVSEPGAQIAWSAGVSVRIPYTPHTLGFYATNVTSGTLEGVSVGLDEGVFWGFTFTLPLGGGRWARIFDPAPAAPTAVAPATQDSEPVAPAPAPSPDAPVLEIAIAELKFQEASITVAPGTVVRWTNKDPLAHTATSTTGAWDSGSIEPGQSWERTFTAPGRYEYLCTPHPFMKGVVVVEGGAR